MRHDRTRPQRVRLPIAAALPAMLILPQLAIAQPAEPEVATTQLVSSRPATRPANPVRLVFQMDRFGRLRQDDRPTSLREVVQTASQAPQGSTAVLQYDDAVPDIQVRELLAALRQTGLGGVTAEPVILERPALPGPVERTDVEEEGLALLQTLADLGRQLPSAIDAMARSLRDHFRDISERAAAASKAAAGAARSFGGISAATQPGAPR